MKNNIDLSHNDLSQDSLLELQNRLSHKTRSLDIVIIALLMAFIFGFSLATLILPDAEFSEAENRQLQQKPRLSTSFDGTFAERIAEGCFLDRLVDGSFTAEVSDYFADQIPLRDVFVGIKGVCEIAAGKMQNNDVMLGKNGFIIDRIDFPDTDYLEKNVYAASVFAAYAESLGKSVTFAVAGRTMDMEADSFPILYSLEYSDRIWSALDNSVAENSLTDNFADLRLALRESGAASGLYYRTDHHWTTAGAYAAYAALAPRLGITPLPESAFTVETASDEFYGTTWSSAGMKWIAPDTMEFWHWDGEDGAQVYVVDTGETYDGLYDRGKLAVRDKYAAFIYGNNAEVRVTLPSDEPRETLLLIKDSYAHSVAPFLAAHFDLIIIDPRYYKKPVANLLDECDYVLFLYNLDSLTNSGSLNILRAGIG